MFSNEENQRKKFKKKKRRRTNEKMRTIIKNMKEDIEHELDAKNEKNDFTTTNIEAIVKEVLRDADVKEMIRQTLHPESDANSPYEPKLTRAKIRELLKVRDDLSFPILWPITKKKNLVSECLSLINENYSENSSEDEEYKPEKDQNESNAGSSSLIVQSSENKYSSENAASTTNSWSKNTHSSLLIQEENIGQRTRSKLPLIDTPLEVIEQAFVPPDITLDMYETECENENWANFIKEFVQPMDTKYNEPTDLDDDQDDPEYNILADEETVDREELREDRDVEVPRQEVNDLIAELFRDCEPMNSIVEDVRTNKDTNQWRASDVLPFEVPNDNVVSAPIIETVSKSSLSDQNSTGDDSPFVVSSDLPLLLPAQRLLLNQQLRQHVQIITTNFLQFHKHALFFNYAKQMKMLLMSIKNLSADNPNSAFFASNLQSAVQIINKWEESHVDVEEPVLNVFKRISKKEKKQKENFPEGMMKVVTKSDAFLYPLLLPHMPFSSDIQHPKHKKFLMVSEEWLLAVGLQEFIPFVEQNAKQNGKNVKKDAIIGEAVDLIIHYLLPCFIRKFLLEYIKKKRAESTPNFIKEFFEKGKATPLKHYVIPVASKPLFKQSYELLPDVWAEYVQKHYLVLKMKK